MWINILIPDSMNVCWKKNIRFVALHRAREKGIHFRILFVMIFQNVFYPSLNRLLDIVRSVFVVFDFLSISDCEGVD